MKRQREDGDNTANKRRRKNLASDIFDDESLNNCFCNVPGVNSAVGYFTGSVPMRWLLGDKKFMFQFASKCCVTLNRTHKVDVTFEGGWVEPMHARWGLMSIMENIQLSLDGVTSVRPQTSKQSAKLVYTDGVMYRRIREEKSTKAEEICFINTWQQEQDKQNDLDWFATPTLPLTGPLSEFVRTASAADLKAVPSQWESQTPEKRVDDSSMVKENPPANKHATKSQEVVSTATSKAPSQSAPFLKTNAVASIQQATIENQPQPALPAVSRKQEKKAKKKAAKAQREALARLAASSAATDAIVTTPLPQIQSSNPPAWPGANPQVVKLGQLLPTEDNPKGWMTVLRRFKSDYTMLKDATTEKKRFSTIGVVRGFKPPYMTPKNDWASNVCLQDPSLFSDDDFNSTRDYTITFFQRRFKEWLPQVNVGDILILHDIKVQIYNGSPSGVGFYDRAKWAVYSIKDGCFIPPKLDQAPKERELVDGGVRFTPFLHTSEPEERYCRQLSAWWKEKSKGLAEPTGQVYNLAESAIPRRTQRQRLLLCDAGPDVEPGGYFDCTFEVINYYQNEGSVPAVYVTDYTKNTQVKPCQAKWCPPGLNDYVVKFDLWDAAANFSQSLVSGTYWSVRNARLKRSHDGYIEGKIVEKKFSKLEPDSEYAPLQELLKRKKEWEAERRARQKCFEHKLIKDVRDGEYVDCTVELLHTSKSYDEAYLEVTDYTAHSKLSSYRYEKEWSRDLEGSIISIQLRNAQMQHANTLRPGAFLKIRNLRLTDNHIQNRFQGYLGGHDILIHRLDIHHPNDDLKALLERKKAREKMKDAKPVSKEQRKIKDNVSDLEKRPNFTVKELQSYPKKIVKVRVIARVITYHPIPSKWIRAWCSKCKQRIPDDKRACHGCQDLDHEFVRWKFRLLLRIEDRNGDAMDVVLGDQSEFLQGLEIGDDFQHQSILSGVTKRLKPLLGDSQTFDGGDTVNGLKNDYVSLIIARHESIGTEPMYILLDVEI